MGRSAILSIRIVSNAKDAERGIDKTNRHLSRLERNSKNTGVQLSRMYQKLDGAARVATRVGAVSIAVQALTVKGAAAARAVAPLAGLLAGLPGVAAAGGAAFATWKVATAGFGDALASAGTDAKKFAEATKGMAPAMVQAVLATKRFTTAFQSVKTAVQGAFWKGVAADIDRLGLRSLPVLRDGMVGVATESNGLVRALLRAAATAPALGAVRESFAAAQRVLASLTPAVAPFVDGLARIVAASARLITGFDGAAGAAQRFQAWAQRITTDGTFARWFAQGQEAASQLGRVLSGVGRIIAGIGSAALAASGPGSGLQGFANSVHRIADAIMRPEIQSQLTESFRRASQIAQVATSVLVTLLPYLARFGPELLLIGAAWRVATTAMALYRGALAVTAAAQAVVGAAATKSLALVVAGWARAGAAALANGARIAAGWLIAMGPVGWVIAAIIAVGAALVVAYNKFAWFRAGVNAVMAAVRANLTQSWNALRSGVTSAVSAASAAWQRLSSAASSAASRVRSVWQAAVAAVVSRFQAMRSSAAAVWNGIAAAASAAGGRIRSALTSAGAAARSAFGGIAGAARSAFNGAVSAARWAMGQISYAVSWIRNAAARVSGVWSSLWSSGLMYQRAAVASTLPEVGEPFYLHAAGPVLSPTSWGGSRESTKPTVINVTVQGAIDPNETARQIKRILDRDSKRDGRQWIGATAW